MELTRSPIEDRQARIFRSNRRSRGIFATLAVVVPFGLGALFHRQEVRLRALADHGAAATAVVASVESSQNVLYTHYRYEVGGEVYTWSVGHDEAPLSVGQPLPITYLPEDPSLSRPGTYGAVRLGAELNLDFQHRLLAGLFAFFALSAGLCHRAVVRHERALPQPPPLLGPVGLGRIVGLILVAIAVGTSFDAKVRVIQTRLFGATPLGLPVTVVCAIAAGVLFAPFVWVSEHLMRLVAAWGARGGALSRFGVLMAVVKAGPELRRSRAIVVGGLVYFVAIVAAWIAFTESRG